MLQPHRHLLLRLFNFFFIFCSCWIPNGVVSDPQVNFLLRGCNPYYEFLVSNVTFFDQNINATLQDIKQQISVQNKHFATAQQAASGGNTVSTLFQCRSYLSIADCVACFDVAAPQILSCDPGDPGGHVVYDGCFLRYDISSGFFGDTTQSINSASCGNETTEESATAFTSAVQQMLTNLQTGTPKINGFSAATKTQMPNNGSTIYGFAQCIETITQSKCEDCLNAQYNNIQTCLPNSDGRAFANGCFLRYSTTSFFPDNQTIDITPSIKQGSSNNKGAVIGGIVGALVALALIFLGLFIWFRQRRRKRPMRAPRGDITGASKLKGTTIYDYKDLKAATRNFSEENKLGEGGFGVVYKGTLKDGKQIAVKKLTFGHFTRMEEDFENEVKLISNVHHRNLVRLMGYCIHDKNRILVYEYMKNSGLDVFLFGKMKGSLNWKQRYDIMIGIARGLTYLHEEFHICIIHRDVKPNNILLDEDFQPKIADFGLARLLPKDKSHLSTKFAGTLGYTAPEYLIHGQLSEKADVYSYGVVILEIISGQKSKELINGDLECEFLLKKAWKLYERGMHVELVDETLDPNEYDVEEVKKVIEVGLLCTQASTEMRPTMSEVVVLLQNKDLLENMKPTMPVLIETN